MAVSARQHLFLNSLLYVEDSKFHRTEGTVPFRITFDTGYYLKWTLQNYFLGMGGYNELRIVFVWLPSKSYPEVTLSL